MCSRLGLTTVCACVHTGKAVPDVSWPKTGGMVCDAGDSYSTVHIISQSAFSLSTLELSAVSNIISVVNLITTQPEWPYWSEYRCRVFCSWTMWDCAVHELVHEQHGPVLFMNLQGLPSRYIPEDQRRLEQSRILRQEQVRLIGSFVDIQYRFTG